MLDVDSVRAFIAIADDQSFTKAARRLGTAQSALSVKLRRLEDRLGVRLIERTPRSVRLSARGSDFLSAARAFVEAHDRAVAQLSSEPSRLALGFAHPLVGSDFPALLARIRAAEPLLKIEAQIDSSPGLVERLNRGLLDGIVVCSQADSCEGDVVGREPVGWYASDSLRLTAGEPLPLVVLGRSCHIRDACLASLGTAGMTWTEVFVGEGALAVVAAVSAGLGIAARPRRLAPRDVIEVGERYRLPQQPAVAVTLRTRGAGRRSRDTLRTVLSLLRDHAQVRAA